jgi:hypothetical protein
MLMNRPAMRLLVVFIAVLIGSGLLVYLVLDRTRGTRSGQTNAPAAVAASPETSTPAQTAESNRDIFSEMFGVDTTETTGSTEIKALRILVRFTIAALLAALLAFGRRRGLSQTKRNPYVAQTQILLAVIAAAMMMIVGDSAARAFGIFAAASLVRFRTNIRDPKETTVLLICLGVGLAAGVGRIEMAVVLTLFVLLTLAIMEYFEQKQIFRAMEVCINTRQVDVTNEVVKKVFQRHGYEIELRELDREDEDKPLGKIVYFVNLDSHVSTNDLSEEIFSADRDNIDKVEWDQKKSDTYFYR